MRFIQCWHSIYVNYCWCFCNPAICATTGGTDSCIIKTSTTACKIKRTIQCWHGHCVGCFWCVYEPTVCATTNGTDSGSTTTPTTVHKECRKISWVCVTMTTTIMYWKKLTVAYKINHESVLQWQPRLCTERNWLLLTKSIMSLYSGSVSTARG